MALQSSGAISLNEIHIEAGGSSGSQATINDSDIRGLIGKGSGAQMSFSEWYGSTAETVLTSGGTVNGVAQRKQITASSFISSGGTLRIPSNLWVWTDSTSIAALIIDIPCTIINEGKIMGQGGDGGGTVDAAGRSGYAGGPAIKINSGVSGVTIQNQSGAYIVGGGGGGGEWGGGGGAGGGRGGRGNHYTGNYNSLTGTLMAKATLNAVGANATYTGTASSQTTATGGGAGGGGGGGYDAGSSNTGSSGGGGGGRQLGGTGGTGGSASTCGGFGNRGCGGNGGANNSAGSNFNGGLGSGGGGGWGAAGGTGAGGTGGAGGKAIDDSGVAYTLSNSGSVWGGT